MDDVLSIVKGNGFGQRLLRKHGYAATDDAKNQGNGNVDGKTLPLVVRPGNPVAARYSIILPNEQHWI